MKKKEKKSELTMLTLQTRLIRQTTLTRQTRDTCHESLITKYKKF